MYSTERHCPANKIGSLLYSITAKNKIQETTIRKLSSCYCDNYKTRLSMTKCQALRIKHQKKK